MEPERAITYLRLSITDRCDMRCDYCRPRGTACASAEEPLTVEEISALVGAFARIGVTKVRLTGGEPLLRPDLVEIVGSVARTPGVEIVGLTTNGVGLEELARPLADAGLTSVNISLDTLDSQTFRRITGSDSLDSVLRGLREALRRFEKVKVNAVVMRGVNDGEIVAIADLARESPLDVRFIELMPLGHATDWWRERYVSASEIRQALGEVEPLPREPGSSARLFQVRGWKGRIGIISPVSEDFCGECNRVRITARGTLKPCLRLPAEIDIRSWLTETDIEMRLRGLLDWMLCNKLSGATDDSSVQSGAMCAIGG